MPPARLRDGPWGGRLLCRHGSARGSTSASFSHPDARGVPAACGCQRHLPAGAWRTSVVGCDSGSAGPAYWSALPLVLRLALGTAEWGHAYAWSVTSLGYGVRAMRPEGSMGMPLLTGLCQHTGQLVGMLASTVAKRTTPGKLFSHPLSSTRDTASSRYQRGVAHQLSGSEVTVDAPCRAPSSSVPRICASSFAADLGHDSGCRGGP
jgi:hypothetical protein